jgi:hypothetical protein
VENVGEHELDLSGYFLASGEDYYRFPYGTRILPKTRVRFPSTITHVTPYPDMQTVMYSPARVPIAVYPSAISDIPTPSLSPVEKSVATHGVQTDFANSVVPGSVVPTSETLSNTLDDLVQNIEDPAFTPARVYAGEKPFLDPRSGGANPSPNKEDGLVWWVLGVLATALLAVVLVLIVRREQSEILAGYEIEEEK